MPRTRGRGESAPQSRRLARMLASQHFKDEDRKRRLCYSVDDVLPVHFPTSWTTLGRKWYLIRGSPSRSFGAVGYRQDGQRLLWGIVIKEHSQHSNRRSCRRTARPSGCSDGPLRDSRLR